MEKPKKKSIAQRAVEEVVSNVDERLSYASSPEGLTTLGAQAIHPVAGMTAEMFVRGSRLSKLDKANFARKKNRGLDRKNYKPELKEKKETVAESTAVNNAKKFIK